MTTTVQEVEDAIDYLEERKDEFDLAGCEITADDGLHFIRLVKHGKSKLEAGNEVLEGIREVISQGWEY